MSKDVKEGDKFRSKEPVYTKNSTGEKIYEYVVIVRNSQTGELWARNDNESVPVDEFDFDRMVKVDKED